MVALTVDPRTLSGAGSVVVAVGGSLRAAVGALTAGYGANTGQDAAGEVFGLAYQDTAESLLKAVAAGVNACGRIGFAMQMSASNYAAAEAASTLGGGADGLATPVGPGVFSAPGAPGTLGPGVPAPALWVLVETFVGDLWPNGDVAGLHAAAGCWRLFGAACDGVSAELAGPRSVVGGHQIAEGELMLQALSKLGSDMAGVGAQCVRLAGVLDDFADEVAHAQHAIRDLLGRLGSTSGLLHEAVEVLRGHGLDEVKRVAEDITVVLHQLKREATAREQRLGEAMAALDDVVRRFEASVRGEITRFVGEDVGNPLATVVDTYVNAGEGLLKDVVGAEQGLQGLDPLRFGYDPEGARAAWAGLMKTGLISHVRNPQQAWDADKELGKQLLHLEDWRRDRPGLGAGENLGDFLMVLTGAGQARGVSEVAGAASRAELEAGGLGKLGELGEAAGAGRSLGEIGSTTGGLTPELDRLGADLPKGDPVPGGRAAGLAPTWPVDPPAVASRSGEPALGAEPALGPAEPARGGPATGLHEPAGAPPSMPTSPGGLAEQLPSTAPATEPVRAPAAPGGSAGSLAPHAPAPSAPASVPHSLAAGEHPPEPGSVGKGGAPHDPVAHGHGSSRNLANPSERGQTDHQVDPTDVSAADSDSYYPPGGLPSYEELQDLTKTEPDAAYYWSGRNASGVGVGPDGSGIAESMAREANGTTLEMLLGKNGLNPLPRWNEFDPESVRFWEDASAAYAGNARGTVTAVVGTNLRPGNVWESVEISRLMVNPNVTRIIQVDPDTGVSTIVFQR